MDTTCCASGARRSRAAIAVVNSLGAVDLVAAIVAEDAQAVVAEAVRHELAAQTSLRVLDLGDGPSGDELPEPTGPKSVYFWGNVDAAIAADPEAFEHAMDALCTTITDGPRSWGEHVAGRVVLIGGSGLLAQLDRLADCLKRGVRYRYILVQ